MIEAMKQKFRWVLLVALFNVVLSKVPQGFKSCDNETSDLTYAWITFDGSEFCYQKSVLAMTYYEAEESCKEEGGHLASIHSEKENKYLVDLYRTSSLYGHLKVWLGLRQDPDSGIQARWSDGTSINYVRWNLSQEEPLEHCAYMNLIEDNDLGKWFHTNCGQNYWALCKKPKNGKGSNPIPPPTPKTGNCEDGWLRLNEMCYKINPQPNTFEGASNQCRLNWKANLASIRSQNVQNLITVYLGSTNASFYWIGGYKPSAWSSFVWKTNEPFDYSNWMRGSPAIGEATCIRIQLDQSHLVGHWSDTLCNNKYPSICQKPINPLITVPSSLKFPTECSKHSEYAEYRNACFRYHESPKSWTDAEYSCQTEGGHLMSFSSGLEEAMLGELIRLENVTSVWIGLTGLKDEHEHYSWSDNTPLYFTNWGPTEMDRSNATQCVYRNSDGSWIATTECEQEKPFVCKLQIGDKPDLKSQVEKHCPKFNSSTGISRVWVDLDPQLDYCYYLEDGVHKYSSALFNCYMNGGDLISIHSDHEIKLLANFAKKIDDPWRQSSMLWIALHKRGNGGWQWTDQSPVDFTSWSINEPSNGTDKNCVLTDLSLSNWKAENCEGFFGHCICAVKKVMVNRELPETSKSLLTGKGPLIWHTIAIIIGLVVIAFFAYKYYQKVRILRRSEATEVTNYEYSDGKLREQA